VAPVVFGRCLHPPIGALVADGPCHPAALILGDVRPAASRRGLALSVFHRRGAANIEPGALR